MRIEKKILIVDDKPENLVALETILKDFDVRVIKANSGNEALAKTIDYDFALALIDVQMPEMDGFETVKLMRQVEKTKFLPVIFLSAIYSEDHFLIQGIETGAVDFIIKPFNTRILQGKVKVFLELYEQKKKLELEIEQRKITESFLRDTEKLLIQAKKKAEESDSLKTAFLANMSHEIRTPLTTIVGFAGLLTEKEVSPIEKKQYSEFISKSSESLITIINDILDVAKIEAGQLKTDIEPVDINMLLQEIRVTFKSKLMRMNKGHIHFLLDIPDETTLLNTDESRLRQIILNLLSNAAKFTLTGSIEFGYVLKSSQIEIFVKDTGVGIPEDKHELIFDRFHKIENPEVINSSGTGLGLSIVKKLANMLGGNITVVSEINRGSVFTVTLPFAPSVNQVPHGEKLADSVPVNPNWASKHVLIVEDEYPTYVLLASMLTPTGLNVIWAKDGREALETMSCQKQIDAVLMDIKMPGMSGIETFTEFRKLNRSLPIIAQTAFAMTEDSERFREIGFDGYISKPIIVNELFKVLNNVL